MILVFGLKDSLLEWCNNQDERWWRKLETYKEAHSFLLFTIVTAMHLAWMHSENCYEFKKIFVLNFILCRVKISKCIFGLYLILCDLFQLKHYFYSSITFYSFSFLFGLKFASFRLFSWIDLQKKPTFHYNNIFWFRSKCTSYKYLFLLI